MDVSDYDNRFIFAWNLEISRWGGLFLVISALIYLLLNLIKARSERQKNKSLEPQATPEMNVPMINAVMHFLLGTVLVVAGSWLLVNSGTAIATALKIPSFIIGLTAVAVGTSLPELITAITAARKQVTDLSISNIIGANILNLGLITGTAAMIRPLTMDLFTKYYAFTWVFIMIIGMMIIFWKTGKMTKRSGIIMLSLYGLYVIGLLISPFIITCVAGHSVFSKLKQKR